jgi:DNA invertase Pin-like site-specific DNA recombinase
MGRFRVFPCCGAGARKSFRIGFPAGSATPSGKAMFGMMGVFAEFERAMIQERVNAGLARARAEGTTLGRPKIEAATDAAIRSALQAGGAGIRKIAATFGVGTGTVQRIKGEMAA